MGKRKRIKKTWGIVCSLRSAAAPSSPTLKFKAVENNPINISTKTSIVDSNWGLKVVHCLNWIIRAVFESHSKNTRKVHSSNRINRIEDHSIYPTQKIQSKFESSTSTALLLLHSKATWALLLIATSWPSQAQNFYHTKQAPLEDWSGKSLIKNKSIFL